MSVKELASDRKRLKDWGGYQAIVFQSVIFGNTLYTALHSDEEWEINRIN